MSAEGRGEGGCTFGLGTLAVAAVRRPLLHLPLGPPHLSLAKSEAFGDAAVLRRQPARQGTAAVCIIQPNITGRPKLF